MYWCRKLAKKFTDSDFLEKDYAKFMGKIWFSESCDSTSYFENETVAVFESAKQYKLKVDYMQIILQKAFITCNISSENSLFSLDINIPVRKFYLFFQDKEKF